LDEIHAWDEQDFPDYFFIWLTGDVVQMGDQADVDAVVSLLSLTIIAAAFSDALAPVCN